MKKPLTHATILALIFVALIQFSVFAVPTHAMCIARTPDVYKSQIQNGAYAVYGTITDVSTISSTTSGDWVTTKYQVTLSVQHVWGLASTTPTIRFTDTIQSPKLGESIWVEDAAVPFTANTTGIFFMNKNSDGTYSSNNGGCTFNQYVSPGSTAVLSDFSKTMQDEGIAEGSVTDTGYHDKTIGCATYPKNLSKGSRDQSVQDLQWYLAGRYNLSKTDYVSGYFGSLTQKLVARFQKEKSLPQTGSVGPLTRAALNKACMFDI